jgi:hypothetical protein
MEGTRKTSKILRIVGAPARFPISHLTEAKRNDEVPVMEMFALAPSPPPHPMLSIYSPHPPAPKHLGVMLSCLSGYNVE